MFEQIKEAFGVYGGLWAETQRLLREAKSQELPEKYENAEREYRKFQLDVDTSNVSPLQSEKDQAELKRLYASAMEAVSLKETRASRIFDLETELKRIENQIVSLRKQKKEIENEPVEIGPMAEAHGLENQAADIEYQTQRDLDFVLRQVLEHDNEIQRLRQARPLAQNRDESKQLRLAGDLALAEAERLKLITQTFVPQKMFFDSDMARVKTLRDRAATIRSQYSRDARLAPIMAQLAHLGGIKE
jgi:hypothetical protein